MNSYRDGRIKRFAGSSLIRRGPPPVALVREQPLRIDLGQSPEQVRSIFGEPAKVVDLGNKKRFVYRDLKMTFLDARVTDVQ
jgi:hypothetical protein